MTEGNNQIAISIIVAGIIIAGAIFLTNNPGGNTSVVNNNENRNANTQNLNNFRSPSEKNDHILGNPNAKVSIVEFSDFECPFCGQLHPTLSRIVEENDDVNWIYRHFPLTQIHSRAQGAAVASECVAKLAGNDAFWSFADAMFLNQRSLGQNLYESEAEKLGVSANDLNSCMNDGSIAQAVNEDLNEAVASGGRGTPFSVVITASGEFIPFSGALPYENVKALVEQALEN